MRTTSRTIFKCSWEWSQLEMNKNVVHAWMWPLLSSFMMSFLQPFGHQLKAWCKNEIFKSMLTQKELISYGLKFYIFYYFLNPS